MGNIRIEKRRDGGQPKTSRIVRGLRTALMVTSVIGAISIVGAATYFSRFHRTEDRMGIIEPEHPNPRPTFGRKAVVIGGNSERPPNKMLAERTSQERDSLFSSFKGIFEGPPLSFEEASVKIAQSTGMPVREYSFSLPDRYGLTGTKRLYSFQVMPLIFFPGGQPDIVPFGISQVFDTHAKDPSDGRIKALASYILSKNDCDSQDPQKAVETISWWVMNNIPPDIANIVMPVISADSPEIPGYGVTHTHSNSLNAITKSGICTDFSNSIADLLNSVGIPSRTVTIHTAGLPRDLTDADSMNGIAHAVLQVNLHSKTLYYDVMPKANRATGTVTSVKLVQFDSPSAYSAEGYLGRYPDSIPFRTFCTAAMPLERFQSHPELREALDYGPLGVQKVHIAIRSHGNLIVRFLDEFEPEYAIFFFDTHHERYEKMRGYGRP